MDRRYQKVGLGVGAIHNPPRAKYSDDTRKLIKLLMEESKLTMLQKKTIQEAVDKGESLPPSIDRRKTKAGDDITTEHSRVNIVTPQRSAVRRTKNKVTVWLSRQVKAPNAWRRRSQDAIVSSGAYEREQYRRTAPLPNKDKQKRHFACMMAFGKDMPETPHGPKILHRARREVQMMPENVDPLDELMAAIRERVEFLKDMEGLGMEKQYRPIIQQEIAQKIRLIEKMSKLMPEETRQKMAEFKYERPPPKPFPMGDLDD
ncbi:UPF0193 protein EVG1 isoform X1 [Harpegnathos saltator]|uniref:UPF0193 protein EVG1-like protein n=1 Tax=Harpegnathos saltator TaxID=610380 RepID=E2BQQ9_HARSA|nr:UPF0193 protein EVG1 isoform X1 [Harpegnathos saltator]EFN81978.1 UPF0193 protein EVG1-like protein [Harpegnathos saltator]